MNNAVKKLQKELGSNEAALVISEPNIFYLTDFNTDNGFAVITEKSSYFLTDSRYIEKAKSTVKEFDVRLTASSLSDIKKILSENGIKKLFVETDYLSVGRFGAFKKSFDGIDLSEENKLDKWLADMRSVKSDTEIKFIKQSQNLTDQTFTYILDRIAVGRTEREIMLDMEFFMRSCGSQGVSFDFIVVSGKNSSLPHGVPTDKRIEKGDFITMDFGAVVGGYRSDMTRTVAVGCVSDEQKKVYDTVLSAQLAAIDAVKIGALCCDIDKTARDIINGAGYEGCFGHALGHSVGIEIHEEPVFSPRCREVLKKGNVLTVEPGIYIEDKFGVRIEDMIIANKDGCENITKSRKDLIIL